jgi:hypothetical protein
MAENSTKKNVEVCSENLSIIWAIGNKKKE